MRWAVVLTLILQTPGACPVFTRGLGGGGEAHLSSPEALEGLGEARDRSEEEWGGVLQSGAGPAWWFCRKDLARQRSRLRTGRDDDSSGVWV